MAPTDMAPTDMAPTDGDARRAVLHGPGAAVEVRYDGTEHADVRVTTRDDAGRSAGRLLCRAVRQARGRRTRTVSTVVDASAPSGGALLEVLRGRVGDDVAGIAMRRAGSSVLVTLELLPPHHARPRAGHRPVRLPALSCP